MNCQPGDLAFVIRAANPENLMRIVEVLKSYDPADSGIVMTTESRQVWLCESLGSPLIWGDLAGTNFIRAMAGPIADECLWPIRPAKDEPADSRKTEQPSPAAAAIQHA